MAVTETVTVINNSGKIISTGRQLVNIWKEAKATYQEKKAQLKAERAVQRSQTFDCSATYTGASRSEDGGSVKNLKALPTPPSERRRSVDDARSKPIHAANDDTKSQRSLKSHRSHHTHRSSRTRKDRGGDSVPGYGRHDEDDGGLPGGMALTSSNLKSLTQIAEESPLVPTHSNPPTPQKVAAGWTRASDNNGHRESMMVHRAASDPSLQNFPTGQSSSGFQLQTLRPPPPRSFTTPAPVRSAGIDGDGDDDLAYGSIPPNLASRYDLDTRPRRATVAPISVEVPTHAATAPTTEDIVSKVRALTEKIEDILDEAQCIHHTATSMITHLQGHPEAAAAVALTLAELSALLAKMSPSFLATLKGGAPAVFALLASPHFLIGATVAVGVTVVMFGGWKIVKCIRDSQEKQAGARAMAWSAQPTGHCETIYGDDDPIDGTSRRDLEEDHLPEGELEMLSSIEMWRRGIANGLAEDGETTVRQEMATRQAQRLKEMQEEAMSVSGHSSRTRRQKSHGDKKDKTRKHDKEDRHNKLDKTTKPRHVPDRHSSRDFRHDDTASLASDRSKRSAHSHRGDSTDRVSRSKHLESIEIRPVDESNEGEEDGVSTASSARSKRSSSKGGKYDDTASVSSRGSSRKSTVKHGNETKSKKEGGGLMKMMFRRKDKLGRGKKSEGGNQNEKLPVPVLLG